MKISFRKKKRNITEYFVYIDGEKFEFYYLYKSVADIEDNRYSIVLTDPTMIRVLLDNEIIKSPGSRKGNKAKFGPNGKEFVTILKNKRKEIETK
jgi:hypothetical protein